MAEHGATNLLVQRKANFKGRTLANNTFDKNLRPMCFRNPPRNREAKPGSGLSGACLVRPIEPLKNNGQVFLRYTDAGILNLSDRSVPVCVPTHKNASDGWRVFHSVVDQDQEQAADRMRVAIDKDWSIGNFAVKLNLLRKRKRLARH